MKAILNGVDVLNTAANEVVASLAEHSPGEEAEDGYAFDFPGLRLAFWRQCRPGEEADDDPQFRGGRFWDTVTTWTEDYHAEIAQAAAALPKH